MLNSMTAFAKTDAQTTWGNIGWEIRGVNHRFLDVNFRLPEQFTGLENEVRQHLRQHLQRGRCDITLRYTPAVNTGAPLINQDYLQQLLTAIQALQQPNTLAMTCDIASLLRLPGAIQTTAILSEAVEEKVLQQFDLTLQIFIATRQREGEQLKTVLMNRLKEITQHVQTIQQRIPDLLPLMRERLLARLQTLQAELNQERLEQEMVYLAQRIDVQEELDRLQTHLTEFARVLAQGGSVGRRLDFLLQELHREINTLGNKANDKLVSQSVVEVKVLLEQLREQIQNVE